MYKTSYSTMQEIQFRRSSNGPVLKMYHDGYCESCNRGYDGEYVSDSGDYGRRSGCCGHSCARRRCHRHSCRRGNRSLYCRDTCSHESSYAEAYQHHGAIGLSFFLAEKLYQAGKRFYDARKESRAREFVNDAEKSTLDPNGTDHSNSSYLRKSAANMADTQPQPQLEFQHGLNKWDTSPPAYTE